MLRVCVCTRIVCRVCCLRPSNGRYSEIPPTRFPDVFFDADFENIRNKLIVIKHGQLAAKRLFRQKEKPPDVRATFSFLGPAMDTLNSTRAVAHKELRVFSDFRQETSPREKSMFSHRTRRFAKRRARKTRSERREYAVCLARGNRRRTLRYANAPPYAVKPPYAAGGGEVTVFRCSRVRVRIRVLVYEQYTRTRRLFRPTAADRRFRNHPTVLLSPRKG